MKHHSALTRALVALVVVAGLFVAGCGGGSDTGTTAGGSEGTTAGGSEGTTASSDQNGVAEAQRLVAEAEEIPKSVAPPSTPVDASAANGKSFMYIPVLGSIPVAQITGAALDEALGLVNAELSEIDGKGQVDIWARGIEQAVSRGMDGIVLAGISPKAVLAPLQAADKAGIPTIASFATDPGLPSASEKAAGVDALVTYSWSEIGRRMAQYVIADSEGKAHVVIISSSDIETSQIMVDAAEEEFDRLCPECEVEVKDSPQTQPAERLTTLTRTIVTQDPSVDYLMPVFDAAALTMVPAIHGAGAADRVKIVTSNGTPAVLQLVQRGDVVVADIGANIAWSGWGVADQLFRLVNGDPVLKTENVPTRTFSVNNVGELDLEGDQSTWFGSEDWKAGFKQAWGLE